MKNIKESKKEMRLVIGDWSLVITHWLGCLLMLSIISSCSVSKQISKLANTVLLSDSAISTGHIGISIYEPATDKYWYNYNADKYFIPASNTKLFTLYAGMKYLGDSLVGLRYWEKDSFITYILPTGDPTFLNQEFKNQPVFEFFKKNRSNLSFLKTNPEFEYFGNGWAWNDYNDDYMVERSVFPMYGNVYTFLNRNNKLISTPYFNPKDYTNMITPNIYISELDSGFLKRNPASNEITYVETSRKFTSQKIPIHIDYSKITKWLKDTIATSTIYSNKIREGLQENSDYYNGKEKQIENLFNPSSITKNILFKSIHSQPSDSLFKPMMHRSDNFFAEQTLLMASNEHLGYMSDEKIIDTILKLDLKDVPQKPKWVDGSGLSRYNLFTPQSFVYILNKIKNEFGWERIKNILPTGGTGTLSSYYKKDSGFIYAKTGTLSNNCALSGYLITKKGKFIIFSILANNYITGAVPVRKAVEKYLLAIRENY